VTQRRAQPADPPKNPGGKLRPPTRNLGGHTFDERAYNRAVKRLRAAIVAMWEAGATRHQMEDDFEEAMIDAGVDD
jgi:hypothetical protein